MKRLLLIFLSSLLFLSSCELFWDAPAVGKVYVVTIGADYQNDTYPNSSTLYTGDDLHGTVADAKELFQAFKQVTILANRTFQGYLLTQEGTSHTISTINTYDVANNDIYASVTHLQTVLQTIKGSASDKDLTIVTYSGHGYEDTGLLKLATTSTSGAYNLSADTLDQTTLLGWMNAIPGKKLLILDSCFSGTFVSESPSSSSLVYDNSSDSLYEKFFSDPAYESENLFVLSASALSDSYELYSGYGDVVNNHNHGVFSYALLAGLGTRHAYDNDGITTTVSYASSIPAASYNTISVDNLYKYVKNYDNGVVAVKEYYQHPMTTGGSLDMTLFTF